MELSQLTPTDIGRTVVYKKNTSCRQEGVITSWKNKMIFVRYGSDKHSKATYSQDLSWGVEINNKQKSKSSPIMRIKNITLVSAFDELSREATGQLYLKEGGENLLFQFHIISEIADRPILAIHQPNWKFTWDLGPARNTMAVISGCPGSMGYLERAVASFLRHKVYVSGILSTIKKKAAEKGMKLDPVETTRFARRWYPFRRAIAADINGERIHISLDDYADKCSIRISRISPASATSKNFDSLDAALPYVLKSLEQIKDTRLYR
jgi:hypothetical protein